MPRLFEQGQNNNPDLTRRIVFGATGVATENMTLTNFVTWLLGKLGFLKTSENLNDLASKSTARTNLGVYSTAQVDTALNTRAKIYPAADGSLKSTNTITFTPSSNYHPATKKYVDDTINTEMAVVSVSNQVLSSGGITYARLYLNKVGKSVNGILRVLLVKTSGNKQVDDYTLPASLRPVVGFQNSVRGVITGDFNVIMIHTTGEIILNIDSIDILEYIKI